ncbi:MAG TPA: monofunctional biosynthetic peptidoglycan transglycosylase, partial [Aurantimonas sp.]|nr:monofunctional biosynthetic peptidoglycan transglycosylase [Aurantimonas sp.]
MIRRVLAAIAIVVIVLVAIPLVLTPIYAIRSIHPVSTLMLADHFTFRPVLRDWVPLEEIAPVMVHSVLMSEDGQ